MKVSPKIVRILQYKFIISEGRTKIKGIFFLPDSFIGRRMFLRQKKSLEHIKKFKAGTNSTQLNSTQQKVSKRDKIPKI
jgi:hypothetical protein